MKVHVGSQFFQLVTSQPICLFWGGPTQAYQQHRGATPIRSITKCSLPPQKVLGNFRMPRILFQFATSSDDMPVQNNHPTCKKRNPLQLAREGEPPAKTPRPQHNIHKITYKLTYKTEQTHTQKHIHKTKQKQYSQKYSQTYIQASAKTTADAHPQTAPQKQHSKKIYYLI